MIVAWDRHDTLRCASKQALFDMFHAKLEARVVEAWRVGKQVQAVLVAVEGVRGAEEVWNWFNVWASRPAHVV